MYKTNIQSIYLEKRFPLRISRGVRSGSSNLFVEISDEDGNTGIGEGAPGGSEGAADIESAMRIAQEHLIQNPDFSHPVSHYRTSLGSGLAPCVLAAFDIALWDLLAKQAKLPLHGLLGLPAPYGITSMTIGIMTAEEARERVQILFENGRIYHALKIKLGSPEGIEADQQMYNAIYPFAKENNISLRVDANGGWSVEDAKKMMSWLAERNCDYVEQPLVEGDEHRLKEVFQNRPLPIYVDESCRFASQIKSYSDSVDGVNLKLMKCGGITGALEILNTARALNLKTMIGCMSESSISIGAGAALTGIIDHIDLDSHLNLNPDVAEGLQLNNGMILPDSNNYSGHGSVLK